MPASFGVNKKYVDDRVAAVAAVNAEQERHLGEHDGDIADVRAALAGKANASSLAGKADKTALADGLATKADKAELNTLATRVGAIDTAQTGRLPVVENATANLGRRADSADTTLTAHGSRISATETKNSTQDQRLTSLESANANAATRGYVDGGDAALGGRIDATVTKNAQQDSRLNAAETKTEELDDRVSSLEAGGGTPDGVTRTYVDAADDAETTARVQADADLDTRLDANDEKDAQQDGRLSGHDTTLANHGTRLTAAEAKNTTQDQRLASLEAGGGVPDGVTRTYVDAADSANAARSAALEGQMPSKASTADLNALTGRVAAVETGNTGRDAELARHDDDITNLINSQANLDNRVEDLETNGTGGGSGGSGETATLIDEGSTFTYPFQGFVPVFTDMRPGLVAKAKQVEVYQADSSPFGEEVTFALVAMDPTTGEQTALTTVTASADTTAVSLAHPGAEFTVPAARQLWLQITPAGAGSWAIAYGLELTASTGPAVEHVNAVATQARTSIQGLESRVTTLENSAGGGGGGGAPSIVELGGSIEGKPAASQRLHDQVVAALPFSMSQGAGLHQARADTAATALTTFAIKRNGLSIGTMTFTPGATTATFDLLVAGFVNFNAGDRLTITAPATPDATLAGIAWTLAGTLS